MCKNCKLQGLFICGEKIRGTGNYTQKTGNDKCSVKKKTPPRILLCFRQVTITLLYLYTVYYMRIIIATEMYIRPIK